MAVIKIIKRLIEPKPLINSNELILETRAELSKTKTASHQQQRECWNKHHRVSSFKINRLLSAAWLWWRMHSSTFIKVAREAAWILFLGRAAWQLHGKYVTMERTDKPPCASPKCQRENSYFTFDSLCTFQIRVCFEGRMEVAGLGGLDLHFSRERT